MFNDTTGDLFALERLLIVLDGRLVFNQQNLMTKPAIARFTVCRGPIQKGEHVIQVLAKVVGQSRGNSAYFSGYQFELKSSHTLEISKDYTRLVVVLGEDNSNDVPLPQRLGLGYAEVFPPPVESGP